ncbi:MAG: KOW domain-containing RNA-binding protein [Lachnospiraceae bacterium]|nr:KOW domain-containing RNA-binding protein [Lachnospiraceae bacterium]
MRIMLGKSLAGHDKNHIYVVYKEEENYLILVNGNTKTIDKPKKKNKMHVQLIKKLPADIQSKVDSIDNLDDEVINDIVNSYNKYLETCAGTHN